MCETAAERAQGLLEEHGITELSFHVVQCTSAQKLRSWESLEQALILLFKRLYGDKPFANIKGKGNVEHWQKDLDRFNEASIKDLLESFD